MWLVFSTVISGARSLQSDVVKQLQKHGAGHKVLSSSYSSHYNPRRRPRTFNQWSNRPVVDHSNTPQLSLAVILVLLVSSALLPHHYHTRTSLQNRSSSSAGQHRDVRYTKELSTCNKRPLVIVVKMHRHQTALLYWSFTLKHGPLSSNDWIYFLTVKGPTRMQLFGTPTYVCYKLFLSTQDFYRCSSPSDCQLNVKCCTLRVKMTNL